MTDSLGEGIDPKYWIDCMAKVAEGRDKQSFMALFDHFSPRVNAYLLGQGVEAGMAEDLTQEALLTLWNKAHLYQPKKAAVSTWLFRVARNLWIDRLRKQRAKVYELEDEFLEAGVGALDPEEDTGELDSDRIQEALAALPQNQAQVVYMAYFEGKSHSEIAADTGMPLGSVKSGLRLALQSLRKKYGEET
ncbi:sigma-70 family RNA polymerase sigma factor [Litorivivens sp.]|uniref:sigma-70 family RNA polymerase sigma factor n=1 Tax=Litorivivens sp. TaxID=2020868 RepID=UPI0035670299